MPILWPLFIGFLFIRFPKDQAIAKKWNIALGLEVNKIVHGHVCCEHFNENDFKRKNKTNLRSDAIPTIIVEKEALKPIETIEPTPVPISIHSPPDAHRTFDTVDSNLSEAIAMVEISHSQHDQHGPITQCQTCKECVKKDYLIDLQKMKIHDLQIKLKKSNSKIWHLESMKRKLDAAFLKLKKEELLNEELCTALQVKNVIIKMCNQMTK